MVAKFLAESGAKLLSKEGELIDLDESGLSLNVSRLPFGACLSRLPCTCSRAGRRAWVMAAAAARAERSSCCWPSRRWVQRRRRR
jgi:hypothetical protein